MSENNTNNEKEGSSKRENKPKTKYKAGKITRNPFLNFLRDFRKKHQSVKLTEMAKQAGEVWRNMSQRDKSPYCSLAKLAPFRRYRRSSRRSRRRRARVSRKRKRSRSYSVSLNESKNKVPRFSNDDVFNLPETSFGPKIIELPANDGEDSVKPLEVIDLT